MANIRLTPKHFPDAFKERRDELQAASIDPMSQAAPPTPRLAERLAGWRERQPRLGPETVHIDITNACNLDCVTCWNYAPGLATPKTAEWKRQRLAAADFHRLLGEVAAAGAERIIISGGGEPFTHPAIYELIAAVRARGLLLTVISNGTLCDWERLRRTPPNQMLVNVAAACGQTYAAYHPNRTSADFDTLVTALSGVADLIRLNLVQVINRLNYAELPAMVELAAAIGARSSFKLGDAPPGTAALALGAGEFRALTESLIPAARARAKTLGSRHNLDAFARQIAAHGDVAAGEAPPCFAGYLYSRIHVDGRVFFCCEHIEVGDVAAADFATIWNGPAYAAVRERIHAGRMYPGCRRCGKFDMNDAAARALAALDAGGAK